MYLRISRLSDQRDLQEDDMMGGKQSGGGGLGIEDQGQEAQPAGSWLASSDKAGDSAERLRARAGWTKLQPGPRILLLIDDPDLGDWLIEEFRYVGCAVALATCGKDGLQFLRSGLVEVVISEMGLPDLPGMDLLRELHGLSKMPKVILTANRHSDFLAERAVQNGASAVLTKPFRMEELLAAIARSLVN
jgi:CheY-like chemotaxis protein